MEKIRIFRMCYTRGTRSRFKMAAKVSGNKKCDLIPMKELLPLTGYIRGGCSPIGMKNIFLPTSITPVPIILYLCQCRCARFADKD